MTAGYERLESGCIRGLLRCFRSGPRGAAGDGSSRLVHDDASSLRFWWALSDCVGSLATRVRERPREIVGVTVVDESIAFGEIPGVLNAAETSRLQSRTMNPSLFVVDEPNSTWLSGPNRVLALTLVEADRALLSHSEALTRVAFAALAGDRAVLVEEALRVQALREILLTPAGRARLTPFERRQAAKARAPLYRLAHQAATTLRGIEDLDPGVLQALFSEALLPSLEVWRCFELFCVLEVTHALEKATGSRALLDVAFSSSRPAAKVGPYSVWWQRIVPPRPDISLDPGEALARALAASLDVGAGAGRADIAVEFEQKIVAFIECKWFGVPDQAPGAILAACSQLVGYARDVQHLQGGVTEELLERSVVALAARGSAPLVDGGGKVCCVDFDDIEAGAFDGWAVGLVA